MSVDRFMGKLFILLLVLGIGVFYGISISKSGIEQIHGPINQEEAVVDKPVAESELVQEVAEVKQVDERVVLSTQADIPNSDTLLTRLFDAVGSLLQRLADGIIQLLVNLGEAVLS